MRSEATTVDDYLAALNDDRRSQLALVRAAIRKHSPKATEFMKYGHPHYELRGPLFALGSQKHYLAFYVAEEEAVSSYVTATGRKNVGKSCIRFSPSKPIETDWLPKIIQSATQLRLGRSKQ